ncbi:MULTISPECIES: MinD/ParA family protein [unclassified Mycobacterium]|uniref:MinD/ParA family ATP-binding protein n=1 Tax=unclassified Mycobacterium TaxID=2642494 RepID=UPI0009ED6661|nr:MULTISPECIES: MinD/ParA family protein [unclassified Mycobacterium]
MSNRGSNRGFIRQPAAPAGRPVPPDRPRPAGWRVEDDPASPTVPQPPPTKPAPARRVPPRRRPELTVGGTALDSLDEQPIEDSAPFSWRELIRRLTGINLGPGKESTYEQQLRDRIRTPVAAAFPVAVLNLKGGVGKTVVVEALGSTFAAVRDDRVIAVDIDAGDLAERHGRRNPLSLADLLLNGGAAQYSEVRAHTYKNSFGLEVLGLPDYTHTDWRLDPHDVVTAFSILRKHYSVVLVDCVKAVNSAVMDTVLPESRALVVVTSTSIDAIRKTRTTLDLLRNNGYQRLMKSTVLAINHVEAGKVGVVAAKELEQLSARVAATVVLPFDRHVHDGKEIGLDRLSKESRRSYLEMAATIADMFGEQGAPRNLRLGASRTPRRC